MPPHHVRAGADVHDQRVAIGAQHCRQERIDQSHEVTVPSS
jgi:hypothetical protein